MKRPSVAKLQATIVRLKKEIAQLKAKQETADLWGEYEGN